VLEPCAQHRDATAGWVCGACESKLCPACAAAKTTAAGEVILCTRCGGRAQAILMKRGELQALAAASQAQASPLGGLRTLVRGQKPSAQDEELVPVLGDTQPHIQLGGGEEEEGGPVGLDSAGNPLSDAPQKPRTYEPIALDDDDGGHFEVERGFLGQPSKTAPVPPQELELDLDTGEAQPRSAPPPPMYASDPGERAPQPAYTGARPPPPPPQAQVTRPPPPPPNLSLQTSEGANAILAGLFAQGQQVGCLDVLDRSGLLLRAETLAPQSWLALGTFALEQKRAKAATFALRRCIDAAPEGVHAPQAWLLAARTYDQLIGDRKTSDRLLQEVATRFPQSKEGQFAARRLATPKG
jgi:hypothetical protein